MKEIKNHTEKIYWLAYSNDLSLFHYGELEVGRVLTTGQPILEEFTIEQEWIDRIVELKGQDFYDEFVDNEVIDDNQ